MVGNVIIKCELLLTLISQFLRPQKIMKFVHGGHLEFQWNLKGSSWEETFSMLSILKIQFIWSYITYWS